MRNDLTDITMVVDRSGSMGAIRTDAEGGINSFIEQQSKEPGEALLTLVQFNTRYEFIHSGKPIKQVSAACEKPPAPASSPADQPKPPAEPTAPSEPTKK